MINAALLVTAIILAMVAIKDGRILREAGLLASCTALTSHNGEAGYWHACRPGRLEGRPDLSRRSCTSHGVDADYEYWRCPERVGIAAGSD